MTLGSARGNDTALLWLACVLALGFGYYVVFGVLGTAIDREHDLTGGTSAMLQTNAHALAQRPALEREERSVGDRLRGLQLDADHPATVARFIHTASDIAAAQHVNLAQIDERRPAPTTYPALPQAQSGAGAFAFEPIPLDVTLRGTYRDLLAMIRDLARAPITMQIEVAAIERNGGAADVAAGGPLTARLHIVLQRLSDGVPLASQAHATPEETHARPL
jgi:hypothetical protein